MPVHARTSQASTSFKQQVAEDFRDRLQRMDHAITLPEPTWVKEFKEVDTAMWTFRIACPYGKDNVTGFPLNWYSRPWLLLPDMTDGEIVRTVFAACMMAVEHEFRETFLFNGERVVDPHFDLQDQFWNARTKRLTKEAARAKAAAHLKPPLTPAPA